MAATNLMNAQHEGRAPGSHESSSLSYHKRIGDAYSEPCPTSTAPDTLPSI